MFSVGRTRAFLPRIYKQLSCHVAVYVGPRIEKGGCGERRICEEKASYAGARELVLHLLNNPRFEF